MAKVEALLKTKFRGSLLGSLVGDCLGGPFEGDRFTPGMRLTVQNYFEKLEGPYFKTPQKSYSDDTVMTMAIARTLLERPTVDYKYMAKQFVEDYEKEPKRGYGGNVIDVFRRLKSDKDIYRPAREQFNGTGSYGNGAAMRITPIALYFYNNPDAMIDVARKSSRLTHTHKNGINGAILQSLAIQQSLLLNPEETLDVEDFTNVLISKMKFIEDDKLQKQTKDSETSDYHGQLVLMKELLRLQNPNDPIRIEEVVGALGNEVTALYSVPTAIFCFLRAQKEIDETDNQFRRTLQYAISMGGDTDTIASMAGAIAGAYYGDEIIDKNILKHCEGNETVLRLAENLFYAATGTEMTQDVKSSSSLRS